MRQRNLLLFGVSALVACALACSSANPATPVAPTSSGPTAATDGSTLKTSAPALQSPSNGARLTVHHGRPHRWRIDAPVRGRRTAAVSLPGDESGGHDRGAGTGRVADVDRHTGAQRVQHQPHVARPGGVPRRGGTVVQHHVLHHSGTLPHQRPAHERQDGRQATRWRVRCRRLAVPKPDRRHRLRRADLRRAARSSSTSPTSAPRKGSRSNGISRLSRWAMPAPSAALAPSGITPGRCTWCSVRTSRQDGNHLA